VSLPEASASAWPHEEQKFDPSGFLWPQFVQYMGP
jgi:hypothetical protein